jgi:hypothetical protein
MTLGTRLPAFLERAYPEFLDESWRAWRAFLYALFGLPLDDAALALFQAHTGRTTAPTGQAREAWLPIGRRGGKSRITALLAVFLACARDYTELLAPGERGIVMLIAADRRQARVLHRYIAALLAQRPEFAAMVERQTAEALQLNNGITIEIHTASFRSVRGYTLVAAVCDEIAFWPIGEDAANPDTEILNALRPAMATIPESLLLCLSSPYARKGELWQTFERHFGRDDSPVLVWNAPTVVMNPTVPAHVIEAAYAADETAAAAEYGGEFRRDIEKFVSVEVLRLVTVPHRGDLPPAGDVQYRAFVDPSGGAADSMTLAIAHKDAAGRGIVDTVVEHRAPFSPAAVVDEFLTRLRYYRVASVQGDRYGGEWPREAFRRFGVDYRLADQTKSELYQALLPLLTSARAELPDHPRLQAQLLGLERRTTRGGRDVIDHAPRQHDDLANAVAGALVSATRGDRASVAFAHIEALL